MLATCPILLSALTTLLRHHKQHQMHQLKHKRPAFISTFQRPTTSGTSPFLLKRYPFPHSPLSLSVYQRCPSSVLTQTAPPAPPPLTPPLFLVNQFPSPHRSLSYSLHNESIIVNRMTGSLDKGLKKSLDARNPGYGQLRTSAHLMCSLSSSVRGSFDMPNWRTVSLPPSRAFPFLHCFSWGVCSLDFLAGAH